MKNIITRLCLPALAIFSMLVLFHSTGSVLSAGSNLNSSALQEEVASGTESKVPTWTVDTVHSCAMFRVRHMGAGFFWGRFNDVSGTIDLDPASWKSLSMDIVIDVASVDSGHPGLDKHLVSPDFFDSKEFPKITFKSSKVAQVTTEPGEETPELAWDVTGNFTMRGISKEITARVVYWGAADMGRGTSAGFESTFKIKRSDFGVNYGVEQGALGDLVTVTAAFEVAAPK
jgi:polyisoprenoid-binding protein YceI